MKPNDKAIEAALLATKTVLRNDEITIDSAIFAAVNAAYAAQFQSEDYAGLIARLRDDAKLGDPICDEAADSIEAVLAERDDFAEQLALRSESGMAKDMQEIMRINNELVAERDALKDLLPNQNGESRAPIPTDWWSVAVLERRKRIAAEKERDALKAENDQHKSVYQKYVEAIDRMNGTPCEQVRHHYEVSELRSELALAVSERDALAARLAPVDDEALVEMAAVAIRRNKFERTGRLDCFDPSNLTPEELGEGRAAIAAIRPHIEVDIADKFINPTPKMIAAAWAVFRRDNYKSIGPGPGFVEAMKAMAAAAIRRGE